MSDKSVLEALSHGSRLAEMAGKFAEKVAADSAETSRKTAAVKQASTVVIDKMTSLGLVNAATAKQAGDMLLDPLETMNLFSDVLDRMAATNGSDRSEGRKTASQIGRPGSPDGDFGSDAELSGSDAKWLKLIK